MNIIRQYEFGLISFEEFTELLWGSGQQLLIAEGEAALTFYLWATSKSKDKSYYLEPYCEKRYI